MIEERWRMDIVLCSFHSLTYYCLCPLPFPVPDIAARPPPPPDRMQSLGSQQIM